MLYKNGSTVDVNLGGCIESPVRKTTEVKHERAVGVDGNVGGQDADEVHGQTGFHHVTRCHRRSLENNGRRSRGHRQHEGVTASNDRRKN